MRYTLKICKSARKKDNALGIRKHFIILFLCSMLPILSTAASPKVGTRLPSNSVAMSDDALATFFNPAGLGTNRALNLYYLRTYRSDDSAGDDAFFISVPGGGFSMEFANAPEDIDFTRYSLSTGRHLGGAMYWGTNYSWINSDDEAYDRFGSLSVGLMYRHRYISIGAIGRDLNRPRLLNQKVGPSYDIGIALRPGTWRATLSVDMQKTRGVEDLMLRYGVEVRPIRELILRGTYNSDNSFDLRFGINIGNMGIGTANYFDENRNADAGVGYFHFSTAGLTKPFPRKKLFLDVGLHHLDKVLRIAKWDKDVVGVLIRIDGGGYGMARLQEMRDALVEFKASGRVAICYLTGCTTGDYIVASVCDTILMHPGAELRFIGLRSERTFYKGGLDKLGIQAHIEHIGEYKSAAEPLTRSDMSEPSREGLNALLDDLYAQLTDHIAIGRGWTPQTVAQRIDQGPFTAKTALKFELVDELLYEEKLNDIATELTGKKVDLVDIKTYLNSGVHPQDWEVPKPKIAIIEAEGLMVTGESFTDPFTGTTVMGADTIARAVKQVREDESIKAVVLRIESEGGLVIAANIIWHELTRLAEVKPLIASMGDIAASGGYYIAAPADVIVAEPGTITGSIGVIGGKYSLKGLYEKLGINKEILKRGAHADFYSDYSDYTPAEQKIVQTQIAEIYDDFLTKVDLGRTQLLTKADVDKVARGRVWTGKQAQQNGLVDELGGLNLALAIAQDRAGLKKKTVELVRLPKQRWLYQLLGGFRLLTSGKIGMSANNSQVWGHQLLRKTGSLKLLDRMRKHRYFLMMPYDILNFGQF